MTRPACKVIEMFPLYPYWKTTSEVSPVSGYVAFLAKRAGWVFRLLLDLLIPPRCLSCRAVTTADGALCAACWDALTFLEGPACACCGLPFELDAGVEALCGACLADPPQFHRARAVLAYDRASRGMILGFKHADRTAAAPAFAAWMARSGRDLLADCDLIVPVPLHRWRLFRRRYNQAALLANAIGRIAGRRSCPDALKRLRHTPMQGSLGVRMRRQNIRGAIGAARPEQVRGRRVLLIDDVFTSGATVGECAKSLLAAGAVQVDVLTLARVVRPARIS